MSVARLFTPKIASFYEKFYGFKGVKFVKRTILSSFDIDSDGKMDTNEDFKSVFLEMLHREICVGHSLLCVGQSLQVQAATPKQIRELMKFDGLTNDEVKSHLQVCICDYPSVLNHNLVDKLEVILHAISDEFFYTYM
ncbi:unnamed protein product [Malus baccata var. baccata]